MFRDDVLNGRPRLRFFPLNTCLGLLALVILLFVVSSSPVTVIASGLIVALAASLAFFRPYLGLMVLLMLIPWLSFAKWTGGMVVEEIDLAVFSFFSVLLLRSSFLVSRNLPQPALAMSWQLKILVLAAISSLCWASYYGYQLSASQSSVFFTNYEDKAGAIRTAKALIAAVLFYFGCKILSDDLTKLQNSLMLGFVGGLITVIAGCLFERWYFTGLSNLSTDYRTTGWFWEMHTGGATLDAYLVLAVPFLLLTLYRSKVLWQQVVLSALLILYLYVALTTFSRGVYIALPFAVLPLLWIIYTEQREQLFAKYSAAGSSIIWLLASAISGLIAAYILFSLGGYRGLLAAQATLLLLLYLVRQLVFFQVKALKQGTVLGLLLAPLLLYTVGIPTLPYIAFAVLWFGAGLALSGSLLRLQPRVISLLCGCLLGLVAVQAGIVAWYWSELPFDIDVMLSILLLPCLLLILLFARPGITIADSSVILPGVIWLCFAVSSLFIMMFTASSYITERFSTTEKDLSGRFSHWQTAIQAMPEPAYFWHGAGVGRFVELNRQYGDQTNLVAQLQLIPLQTGNAVFLRSGNHVHGYGELFRLTQQVAVPQGPLQVAIQLRYQGRVSLLFEVCDKHLLYHGKCSRANLRLQADTVVDELHHIVFDTNPFSDSWRYQLTDKMFSLALSRRDTEAIITNLQLQDQQGIDLLKNGDFEQGMRHWFYTSDRNHMPYHVKGMVPLQFFEQGLIGAVLWTVLFLTVSGRLLLAASRNTFSAAIAAALAGVFLVGLFDSVIDSARMAFIYFALLFVGAGLRTTEYSGR